MNDQNLGRGQDNALEHLLTSLYQQETPRGYEAAWRAAVRREENNQMQTKDKRGFWKIALPSAAAVVLVVGALVTGTMSWDSGTEYGRLAESKNAASNQSLRLADGGSAPNAAPRLEASQQYDAAMDMEWDDFASAAPSSAAQSGPTDTKKIIRTADMALATTAFDQDEEALRARVNAMGGYVESFYQYGDGSAESLRRLSMTLRIPTERLDEFLSGAAGIGRMTSRSENAVDMTVQYADTALRLETQRGKMERLQALLTQAETVSDLLEIETEIANTQYQLDAFETSLRGIDRQVERSAVTVTLVEESPAESAAASGVSLGQRVLSAFRASLRGIGGFFQNMLVFVVLAAPVVAGLAVVTLAIWLMARHRKARRNRKEEV